MREFFFFFFFFCVEIIDNEGIWKLKYYQIHLVIL